MKGMVIIMTTYFAFAISTAIPALICFIVSRFLLTSDKKFIRASIATTGKVIGYATEEHSSWITPQIQFEDNGKMVIADANTAKIKDRDCPPGKIVNIKYVKKTIFGTDFYEVRLINEGLEPIGDSKASSIIFFVSMVLFVIAFIFMVIGLNK